MPTIELPTAVTGVLVAVSLVRVEEAVVLGDAAGEVWLVVGAADAGTELSADCCVALELICVVVPAALLTVVAAALTVLVTVSVTAATGLAAVGVLALVGDVGVELDWDVASEVALGAAEVGAGVAAGDAVELDEGAGAAAAVAAAVDPLDVLDEPDVAAADAEDDDVPEAEVPEDDSVAPVDAGAGADGAGVEGADEAGADVADEAGADVADEAGADVAGAADDPDDVAGGLDVDAVDEPDDGATAFVTGAVADPTAVVTPETALLTPEASDVGPDAEALEAARRQSARATMLVALIQSDLTLSLCIRCCFYPMDPKLIRNGYVFTQPLGMYLTRKYTIERDALGPSGRPDDVDVTGGTARTP